jgi:(hydroxyamino)benzene mutase
MTNENSTSSNNEARQILFHGGLMTLLSLLSGFTTFFALAPRVALSSHTIGLIQGAMLIAIAGAWHLLNASPKTLKIIKYTLLIGFYANWVSLQLSALWSAGRDTFPITGKDMPEGAAPWQDMTVTVMGFLSVLILVSAVLIILAARDKDTK